MNIFIHVVALYGAKDVISLVWTSLGAESSASAILRSIISSNEASFIGVSAFVAVVVGDSVLFARLWSRHTIELPGPAGQDLVADQEDDTGPWVTTTMLNGLWAIIGLAGVVIGGLAVTSSGNLGLALRRWPDQLTMSAVVIAMALILSALILASVLLLTARLSAIATASQEAERARFLLDRADQHLAVIAKHRGRFERSR